MAIRISGLSSGMDTEAIVQQLVSAYSYKKDNYVKAQTKLSWKQDAWKALNTKVNALYKSLDSLRLSTASYNAKLATASDSTKASVKASNSAVNGSYSLRVQQMAKSGYLTGGKLASGTTAKTTLGDILGDDAFSGGRISVKSAGKTTEIAVTKDTTVNDFISKLNEAGVKATYDSSNQRIYVAAKDTGAENDFSLTGIDANGNSALKALGLSVKSTANTAMYQSWADYSGQDIQGILDQIAAAKQVIEDSNNGITQEKAEISKSTSQKQYASNYKIMMNAMSGLDSAEEVRDLNKLSSMSTADKNKVYALDENGNLQYDADGNLIQADDTTPADQKATGAEVLDKLAAKAGLVEKREGDDSTQVTIAEYAAANKAVEKYEADAQNDVLTQTEKDELNAVINDVHAAYADGTIDDYTDARQADITARQNTIKDLQNNIKNSQAVLDKYELLDTGEDAATLQSRIDYAVDVLNNGDAGLYSEGATRINGQDSIIYLNDAMYESSSNTYSINGLTVEALGVTGTEEVNVTVKNDVDGIYNKIKDFLKQYNELINEMTSLYNADSAKGYEPLTTEEKDSLTDTEIEEWENKIKSALLRRDDNLYSIMNGMTSAMAKSYEIGGKKYSLASFGITTLGVLNAPMNTENAYHIDGDSDDTAVSAKSDKLREMIEDDPDTVAEFMKNLTQGLYKSLDSQMKSSKLRSAFTIYNDKQMATEYSNYTDTIKKWEEKVSAMEDSYYKKFAAMETALAKLQSSTSSLSSLFG